VVRRIPSELVIGMRPEQLRQSIVRATMPLIGEYDTLTMARIAGAAGISEADLISVFADKDAVIQACMSTMIAHLAAVSDPAEEVRKLHAIRADQPVASRLLEVIDILGAYYERVRTDLVAFEQAGFADDGTGMQPGSRSLSRNDFRSLGSLPEIQQAVAKLLKPDEHRLRLPAEALAEVFLGMSRFCTRAPNEVQPLPAKHVVSLFLHGAVITD
jgi:AcrR family transcriptional regulator